MEQMVNNQNPDAATDETLSGVKSATKLTPLQLNNIRLDIQHTVLTPDYLEQLDKSKE